MPPFRKELIYVDRLIDEDLMYELRRIGHGHRINIVDASYDIPDGARVVKFPGSSADAFAAIVRCIPIDNESDAPDIIEMLPDSALEPIIREAIDHIALGSHRAIMKAARELVALEVGFKKNRRIDWTNISGLRRKDDDEVGGRGFYTEANDSEQPVLYVRTTDDLPFACITLVVGHSQRTE